MADVKRSAVSSFVDWASNLLEEQGKDVTWFGGTQLAPVIEETVNACYRNSLLSEIDIRSRPMLMVELARNKSAVSRSKGRPLSELEMELFFPVAVGRGLDPRDFLPELPAVVAEAALASVTASASWLGGGFFDGLTCRREELIIAYFFIDCDRQGELFRAYDAEDRMKLREIIAEVLDSDGESLRCRLGTADLSVGRCEQALTRWGVVVALWYWAMPKAFEEGTDEYLTREV